MTYTTRGAFAIAALAALFAVSAAQAQTPGATRGRLEAVSVAVEAVAGKVALPASVPGSLVMATCADCTPRSFETTAATRFLVQNRPVSIAELLAAILKNPDGILTVSYLVKTGVVTEVSAAP